MSISFVTRVSAPCLLALAVMSGGCDSPTAPPPPSPPAVLKVSFVAPNTGLPGVATPVTIIGTGFQSGAKLTLGGAVVDAVFVNSSKLTAMAPAHPEGPIDVVVTNPDGERNTLVAGFSYANPPPILTGLTLAGNVTFTSAGESSQLSATAQYSDGSTKDVSKESRWFVELTGVATISAAGLVTATGLGATPFFVQYPISGKSFVQSSRVTVTPPGTFATQGWVREPGTGGVPNARVVHESSGLSVLTNVDGEYTFGGLTNGHFSVTKDGYEPAQFDATADSVDEPPLQRIIRIAAGEVVSSSLASNDMDYVMSPGQHCQPCHLIRVTTAAGTLHVKVTWTATSSVLNIWVNGQLFLGTSGNLEVDADAIVGDGEVLLYVGKLTAMPTRIDGAPKVPFTVSTLRTAQNPER